MHRAATPALLALALVVGLGLVVAGIVATAVTRAAPARAGDKVHTWSLRLAPAPNDFALAQIRFPGSGRRAIARDPLKIEMQAPFGSDYLAAATPRAGLSSGGMQALVLLVNRPSALEDPVSVRLQLSTSARPAEHELRRVENPGEGCLPVPGYACPGAVESSSPAAALAGDRRAATRAH